MLVNNPNERFMYEAHDAAWRDKNHHGYIEDFSEEVLALGANPSVETPSLKSKGYMSNWSCKILMEPMIEPEALIFLDQVALLFIL